jgi:tetratricopeptide (TPR) repeat protein
MDEFADFLATNSAAVFKSIATALVMALLTYLYRKGSWTKDHRRARLFEEQGDKFLSNALFSAAIEQYKDANKIWEQEVNQKKMLAVYHKIGRAYAKSGDSEHALEALIHCEMLWEELKKDAKMYDIYFELAQIYLSKRNWERASAYISLTIQMLRAMRSPRLPIALSLAARIARERGRPEEAENEYVEAVHLLDDIGDTLGLASVYYELGDLKSTQQCRDVAKDYYGKSAAAYEQLGSARAGEIRSKLQALG